MATAEGDTIKVEAEAEAEAFFLSLSFLPPAHPEN